MNCTAFIDDALSSFVMTDEVSDKENGKKESLTICSVYKESRSDSGCGSDRGSIGDGGTGGGLHNKPVRKPKLYAFNGAEM